MSEGLIAEWRVQKGDQINIGDILFVFETDKATVEHEADVSGTVASILADTGSSVPVGETVCLIEVSGSECVDAPIEISEGKCPDVPVAVPEDSCAAAPADVPDSVSPDGGTGASSTRRDETDAVPPRYTPATPWVRKLAKNKGIPLAAIAPTGNNGRITPYDVELAAENINQGATATLGDEIAMTGIKRITGIRMAQSFSEVPHIYFKVKVNMAEVAALRKTQAGEDGSRFTYSDFFLCAVARAIAAFPIANASWINDKIYANQDINIGFATATPKGLVVPVVAQAQRFTFSELSRIRREIVEKALNGKLMPEEMEGGTFTITNLGSFDVDSFQPIINPPQAAILAIGAIRDEVIVRDQSIKICPVTEICLAGDHRVMDGADCAAFLSEIKRRLENAAALL